MVTRTHPAPKLRLPVRDIPLESTGRDDAGLSNGDDADVLVEELLLLPFLLPLLADVNPVHPPAACSHVCFQKKGEGGSADEEEAACLVVRVLLEEVEMVELAEALVYAAA